MNSRKSCGYHFCASFSEARDIQILFLRRKSSETSDSDPFKENAFEDWGSLPVFQQTVKLRKFFNLTLKLNDLAKIPVVFAQNSPADLIADELSRVEPLNGRLVITNESLVKPNDLVVSHRALTRLIDIFNKNNQLALVGWEPLIGIAAHELSKTDPQINRSEAFSLVELFPDLRSKLRLLHFYAKDAIVFKRRLEFRRLLLRLDENLRDSFKDFQYSNSDMGLFCRILGPMLSMDPEDVKLYLRKLPSCHLNIESKFIKLYEDF